MSQDIQHVLVDFQNKMSIDTIARIEYNTSDPIVMVANQYNVAVEQAEVSLSSMPLDLNPDYKILIMCNLKDAATPAGMVYGANYYSFSGTLHEVEQLVEWLYGIFHKKALPFNLGGIGMDAEGYFSLNIPQAAYDTSYATGNFEIYFNHGLRNVFPEFLTTDSLEGDGQLFYRMKTTPGVLAQAKHTLSRLLKARAIRIYSTPPTTPYRVIDSALNTSVKTNLLTTVGINSESFDMLNKTNRIYEPKVLRYSSLQNTNAITSFDVWIKIYYVDGTQIALTMQPGEYCNVLLAFIPRDSSV